MTIASRVWGGPFKTPPLQHPITVGWVLLKLFETMWRLFLMLVAIAAAVGAWAWYEQAYPLKDEVKITVLQKSPDCKDPEYPVRVTLENESNKTLGEIDFAFRLYEQGESENIIEGGWDYIESHSILEPNYVLTSCYRMPKPRGNEKGPFYIAADVTYAAEVSKDVPVAAPPPMVQVDKNEAR